MYVSATVGVIVGAANPIGSAITRALLDAGATSITLLDGRSARGQLDAQVADLAPPDRSRALRAHALDLDDPVALAQRLAGVRHDEGPVDWIVHLLGPGPGGRAGRPDSGPTVQLEPAARWPDLSLAAAVGRVQSCVTRTVVLTRLAREEFRHRGGVLVHGWDGDDEAADGLWRACRAAVAALVAADTSAAPPDDHARPTGGGWALLVAVGDGAPVAGAVTSGLAALRPTSPAPVAVDG